MKFLQDFLGIQLMILKYKWNNNVWKEAINVSKGKKEGGDSPWDIDNKLFSKQFDTVGSGFRNKMHILTSNSIILDGLERQVQKKLI